MAAAKEKCAKCGADAADWVTGHTLTLEHPGNRYLVYLCPTHFADEQAARERQQEWVERKMKREQGS
jgi:hypothetical protein